MALCPILPYSCTMVESTTCYAVPHSLSFSLLPALSHIHTYNIYPPSAILRPYGRPRALFIKRSQANLGYDGYNGAPLGGESVGPRAGSAASNGGAPPNSLVRFTKLDIDNDDYNWGITAPHRTPPPSTPLASPPTLPSTYISTTRCYVQHAPYRTRLALQTRLLTRSTPLTHPSAPLVPLRLSCITLLTPPPPRLTRSALADPKHYGYGVPRARGHASEGEEGHHRRTSGSIAGSGGR